MNKDKNTIQNALTVYRLRMGFSQKRVSSLLGHKDSTLLSSYEHGRSLPPLWTALKLGIILRTPIEFLYPAVYGQMREHIRAHEERLEQPRQEN
jgi:DNA-binding XRE family transcriptional regulator